MNRCPGEAPSPALLSEAHLSLWPVCCVQLGVEDPWPQTTVWGPGWALGPWGGRVGPRRAGPGAELVQACCAAWSWKPVARGGKERLLLPGSVSVRWTLMVGGDWLPPVLGAGLRAHVLPHTEEPY